MRSVNLSYFACARCAIPVLLGFTTYNNSFFLTYRIFLIYSSNKC